MTDATPSLANEILVEIRRVIRRVGEHSRATAQRSGLTLPQVLVMRAITEAEPSQTTVVSIARAVQLAPATVSGIVDRLTRAGLVHRERDSRDRRRVVLSVTEAGDAKLEALPTPLQDNFTVRLAELPADQRETLLASLRQLVQLMDATEIDASPILAPGEIRDTPEPDAG